MDRFVLDKINEKPAAFFKKFSTQYFYPFTYSKTHLDWYVREEGYRIGEINEAAKYYPTIAANIANFVVVLETYYSDEKYDYKNDTYVSAAIKLYKKYFDRLERYIRKKVKEWEVQQINDEWGSEEIFKELVYRGYIPIDYLKAKPLEYYIIVSNASGTIKLIYPKYFTTIEESHRGLERFGILGITSISQESAKL